VTIRWWGRNHEAMSRRALERPDYLPKEVLAWADARRESFELIVMELLRVGEWSSITALTSRPAPELADEDEPVSLNTLMQGMPRPLGFIESQPPRRIVLSLFGLRLTYEGQRLLNGFVDALRIASERFQPGVEDPVLARADLPDARPLGDPYMRGLSEILLREAPFLGSGSGGPGEQWSREVTSDIARYDKAQTPDDYLRIRAHELYADPEAGWRVANIPPRVPTAAMGAGNETADGPANPPVLGVAEEMRDVFISHASEDKDAVARPLAKLLQGLGYSVWFDEEQLMLGDSLSQSVDRGLAHSRFGVVIVSPMFFTKRWPLHELGGLVAKKMADGEPSILPVWHNVDERDVIRHAPTLADVIAANTNQGLDAVAKSISVAIDRRRRASAVHAASSPPHSPKPTSETAKAAGSDQTQGKTLRLRIPVTDEEQAKVVAERPDWWEQMLYAGVLLQGKEALEGKWEDHELRLPGGERQVFDRTTTMDFISRETVWMGRQIEILDRLLGGPTWEQAFGALGEPGNPVRVENLARNFIKMYEALLDWSASLRNAVVPDVFGEVLECTATLMDQPVLQMRGFIDHVVDQFSRLPELTAGASEENPIRLELNLMVTLDDAVKEKHLQALKRAEREFKRGK
jgi:hypothetical protein